MLPNVSNKKVLFVGERIKDVYHYGRLIGRPPKEPIVCVELEATQVFEGGVTAAAEHARAFVQSVDVVSTKELVKERFVDSNRYRKLFEVYSFKKDIEATWPEVHTFDSVIVTDYGHGMMTQELIGKLWDESSFLAVNVQTNSGNYGFNLATKYRSVDYLCVDEIEARLATQNQTGPIEESLEKLASISPRVVVTLGRNGAIGFQDGIYKAPSIANRVVDTMGAGDAFFAVTACIAPDVSMPDLLKIGNAAASLKAQSVGQRPINRDELRTYLGS